MGQICLMYEIERAFFTEKPKFSSKKPHSQYYLKLHWKDIILGYKNLSKKLYIEHHECITYNVKMTECIDKKLCPDCGAQMIYKEGYGFWSCTNWNDGNKHTTFSGLVPRFFNKTVTVHFCWVTDILKQLGINTKIKSTDCLDLLLEQGYEDLRVKYGYEPTNPSNSWDNAKINSDKLELAALDCLKSFWHTVHYQQCIAYTFKGSKENYCIPDFICTNKSLVTIYESKLGYVNDEQVNLYMALMKVVMAGYNDTRRLSACYIMWDTDKIPDERPFQYETEYPILYI